MRVGKLLFPKVTGLPLASDFQKLALKDSKGFKPASHSCFCVAVCLQLVQSLFIPSCSSKGNPGIHKNLIGNLFYELHIIFKRMYGQVHIPMKNILLFV